MKFPRFNTVRHTVGVVGLYRAGKTVFLTSLINHLLKHDPRLFPLGNGRAEIDFKAELPPDDGFDRFPYLEHRNRLVYDHAWPLKTRATSQYRCSYFRSDWRFSTGELTLMDFAGERLADLPMASLDYATWSDLILTTFTEHAEYRAVAQPYLDLVRKKGAGELEIIDAYRRTMASLFLGFRPVVTPSTFILREDGGFVGDQPRDRLFEKSFSGLDAQSQFAPLPQETRHALREIAGKFTSRYNGYRKAIALPLAKWMKRCNELVVLVDVTTLLAGGLGMYEGNRELLRNLFQSLKPGKGFWGLSAGAVGKLVSVFNPLSYFGKSLGFGWDTIHRVGFVATKADKVHEAQRPNLKLLLRDMVRDLIGSYVQDSMKLDVEYFVCAAAQSTRSTPDGRLEARLPNSPQTQVFTPSLVPEQWPADWKAGQFRYPDVAPVMPPRRDAAPEHLELNRVVDYLMRG